MARRDVLVVDDDPSMTLLLSRLLESRGLHVRAFVEPQAALASALEVVPSLVLTDWAMPKLGGDELARALRTRLAHRTPPLVLVTASRFVPREVEALFDAVLEKPFRLERVTRTVDALVRTAPSSHMRLVRPRRRASGERDGACDPDERETDERETG
ncbi:MAG: response regulator [Sandaracinaceae bacterium]|nr:response regulator [Sandaracinaceae bacterium]